MSTAVPPDRAFNFRSVLPMLVVDVACPYLTYRLLRQYAPGIPIVFALALSGVFPALGNIVSLIRNRTLDIIGIIVLVGIAVSIVAAFVGGDPKVVLIRESFVTGALGGVCLLSLMLLPCPPPACLVGKPEQPQRPDHLTSRVDPWVEPVKLRTR